MPRDTKGLIKLENMAQTASMYLGERDDGGLLFLKTSVEIDGRRQKVHKNAQLAMALTESCEKEGYGAFYYFIPLVDKYPDLANASPEIKRQMTMLPDLFYSPGDFCEPGRGQERETTRHKQRYMGLNARGLSCDKSGLAISVNYNEKNIQSPILDINTACNVSMFFDPGPNVGFTADIAWGKARLPMLALGDSDDTMKWKNAERFRQEGIEGLVRGVRELYVGRVEEKGLEVTVGIVKEAEGTILERAGVIAQGEYDDLGVEVEDFINAVSENVSG